MRRFFIAGILFALTPLAEARMRPLPHRGWTTPLCTSIDGPPGLRFVAEPGLVRKSPDETTAEGVGAIAAGPGSNIVYAYFENGIYESRDAGCSWKLRAQTPPASLDDFEWAILPANDRIYVHSNERLLRLTGDVLEIFPLLGPYERMFDMVVDPSNSLHLRGISENAKVFDSIDGGASWQMIGQASARGGFRAMEVSPKNLDRLYGADYEHLFRSDDGGRTWTTLDLEYLVSLIESSPVDENVVWIRAADVAQQIVRLYGSIDGGRSFALSIPETGELRFQRLAAHAREANVLAAGALLGPVIVTMDGGITTMREIRIRSIAWSPAGTLYYGVHNYATSW
ncbi:MAG TPA: hypothetical protein VGQ36_03355 [Thermoanaerobaculia bacterium]|nr:hypothetical protein [Thermoanaerobaculia bacterium]